MRRRIRISPFYGTLATRISGAGESGSLRRGRVILALLLVPWMPSWTLAQTNVTTERIVDTRLAACQLIEEVARANNLPVDFFVRVIWQESRFQPDVLGPLTRSGERAQGIAQFMPSTAAERRLFEPFNPLEALPKSGELLAELRDEFRTLGLAAAAYNAGPQRVREFVAGLRGLPEETRRYVLAITGRPIEDWTAPTKEQLNEGNNVDTQADRFPIRCRDLVALLEHGPDTLSARWEGFNVPSWCKALHHPNVSVCGPVHLTGSGVKTASNVMLRSHVHISNASSH